MTKKNNMYSLLKIKIKEIINADFNLELDEHSEKEYLVKLPNSPLFDQIEIVRGKYSNRVNELIFVEAKRNKPQEEHLIKLLNNGFTYNNKRYIRFGKSPSQGKDGITTFIDEKYFKEVTERSQLGLVVDKCVISKYESYRSLIFSSCTLVDRFGDKKLPYIVIVDEFEKVLKNQKARYVEQKEVEYLDKSTGEKRIIKNHKLVKDDDKTTVTLSPFDGFGVHTPEISKFLANSISNKCKSVLFQIRLPFMKGVTVEVNFKKYFKEELNIETITDVFGKVHKVEDIDCIWNTSMWKGFKYFKDEYNEKAWEVYLERLEKYNYKLGISKHSHHMDNIQLHSRMNFQYLQCLDLINPKYVEKYKDKNFKYDILDEDNHGKIINLAKYSTNFVNNIVKGDKLSVLKFLGIHSNTDSSNVQSYYEKAILINDEMLHDVGVKKMLKRRLDRTINMMKFGKIYVNGFYHTVVGDVIGYLEHCAKKEVRGCLKANQFYAKTLPQGECISMRSPLVDPSEVNKINIVENDKTKKWLSHFEAQDIVMINMYDLTMQQQGGMDMDGDSVLLTNDEIVVNSRIDLPIVVDKEDKKGASETIYNKENITAYELNSRDSRIGEITNIATSILNQYSNDEKWKKINQDNIALLRLYQGKEIDFLKTGFRWNITKNLRNYLKKTPKFLLYNYPTKLKVYNKLKSINKGLNSSDKVGYNAFNSPSPMNELCDYICQWERKNIKWDNSVKNTGGLLIDKALTLDNKKLMRSICGIYNEFTVELREYIDEEKDLTKLFNEYEVKLDDLKGISEISDVEFVNYCIKSSYRSISTDKTLCWSIFGKEMLDNLRCNSDENEDRVLIECQKCDTGATEFLGRYYKLEKVRDNLNAE